MGSQRHLRIGVIGVGTAGRRHIAAYQKRQDASVVAVVDPDLALGEDVAAGLGARHYPKASEDFWEAVDAVSVCAPHHLLAGHAFQAIDRRTPMLLEKPMALTLEEADAIVAGARRRERAGHGGLRPSLSRGGRGREARDERGRDRVASVRHRASYFWGWNDAGLDLAPRNCRWRCFVCTTAFMDWIDFAGCLDEKSQRSMPVPQPRRTKPMSRT